MFVSGLFLKEVLCCKNPKASCCGEERAETVGSREVTSPSCDS